MKKIIYYGSLVVLWVLINLLIGLLLVASGIIHTNFGLGASLGTACGHPQLWLISVGVVLLARPVICKLVYKEERKFKKVMAVVFVVVGTIWLAMNVGARMYSDAVTNDLLENHMPK